MKTLVMLVGLAMAIVNGKLAYDYSKKKSLWIRPWDFAALAAALTLFAGIAIIVFLDEMGWYFD